MESTSRAHYERHLAEIYSWMSGGAEAAIARGAAELDAAGIDSRGATGAGRDEAARPLRALDLGAGFGAHAIPLARIGYEVVAVDASAQLLGELRALAGGLPVRTLEGDLVEALGAQVEALDLLLCMGDTLTHLGRHEDVHRLCALAGERVRTGGRLLFTFRDYTRPAVGERSFFLVRADPRRIASCVIEIEDDRVQVHDLLHEAPGNDGWRLRVSSYRKLRLAPSDVEGALGAAWRVERTTTPSGMVAISALRT